MSFSSQVLFNRELGNRVGKPTFVHSRVGGAAELFCIHGTGWIHRISIKAECNIDIQVSQYKLSSSGNCKSILTSLSPPFAAIDFPASYLEALRVGLEVQKQPTR